MNFVCQAFTDGILVINLTMSAEGYNQDYCPPISSKFHFGIICIILP